jgi:hypothetical protein
VVFRRFDRGLFAHTSIRCAWLLSDPRTYEETESDSYVVHTTSEDKAPNPWLGARINLGEESGLIGSSKVQIGKVERSDCEGEDWQKREECLYPTLSKYTASAVWCRFKKKGSPLLHYLSIGSFRMES